MSKYFLLVCCLLFFVIGIYVGMIIQQLIFQTTLIEIASNLEGVEINIDINETQILEGTKEIAKEMIAAMKSIEIITLNETTNETLHETAEVLIT